MARRRRRNPEQEIPFGEWVPANAVMFHSDGTVDVWTDPNEPPATSSIFGRSGPESGYSYYPSTLSALKNRRRRRNVSPEEVRAGARVLIAVTEAIHDAGEIPSGHLYAMLSGHMDHQTYESMIRTLLNTGLVEKRGDLLRWVGPE